MFMKKAQFGLGIILGIILLPFTWVTGLMVLMALGFEGQNASDTILTLSLFVLAIASNIALPIYICKQAKNDAPLFSSFNKIPLPFLFFLLAIMIGFIVYWIMP